MARALMCGGRRHDVPSCWGSSRHIPQDRWLYFRMEKVGFLQDDPLFDLVRNAYHAALKLSHELHYMSCKNGVVREPRE
jgi:hypothetical protein